MTSMANGGPVTEAGLVTDLDFRWLPPAERQFFKLSPFQLTVAPGGHRGPRRMGRVLLSAWAGEGVVSRLGRASDGDTRRMALELAELTGDPVVVGEVDSVEGVAGEPVYKAIGMVTMAKARDPLSPEAWVQEVTRLAARLGVFAEQEAAHLTAEAMEWFRFDFEDATGRQIATATGGLRGTLASPRGTMVRSQQVAITRALRAVMAQTGAGWARLPEMAPRLGSTFNLPDRRIAQSMARHHGFWVRNQYGRVSQSLARQAQPIIQQGISQGLGRDTIGKELERQIQGGLQMRWYWRIVAANHISRARSYAAGYTMRAAGITHYRIEAILDEATTETCLMLHNRLMPIDGAMARQEAIMRDPSPDGVLWNQPFMKQGVNPETGEEELFLEYPDNTRATVATVQERGAGTGSPGRYSNVMNSQQMVSSAIGFPPYHHACRTTLIAEVGPV